MMMDGCDGGMLVWTLLFVALIGGGIWLAVQAFRSGDTASRPAHPTGSSALRILEDRYARGEIDRDEFDERRQTLRA